MKPNLTETQSSFSEGGSGLLRGGQGGQPPSLAAQMLKNICLSVLFGDKQILKCPPRC